MPRNLHKREIISPSQLLSFSKLPEPASRAASRAADVMEMSVQEAMRRAHLRSAPPGPPTGEHPGEGGRSGRGGAVPAGCDAHSFTGQMSGSLRGSVVWFC